MVFSLRALCSIFVAASASILIVGCSDSGANSGRTQDARLYGDWLIAGVEWRSAAIPTVRSVFDMAWHFDRDSLILTGVGVEIDEFNRVPDTVIIDRRNAFAGWYVSGNKLCFSQNVSVIGLMEWYNEYTITNGGALVFLSAMVRDIYNGGRWVAAPDYYCGKEAVRQ